MEYPKSLKIGAHRYEVKLADTIPGVHGYVNYTYKYIKLAQRSSRTGCSYKRDERDDTFWHELTHAILYEMGHKLYSNEKFVSQFASHLTKAINSARF